MSEVVKNVEKTSDSTEDCNNRIFDDLRETIKDALRELLKEESTRPPDALWDMQQTAIYLGIQPQTLSLWNTKGKGPAPTKIGGRTMYRPEIVRQYAVEKTLPR